MFIKRDLRKISEILGDDTDSHETLKFSNRKAEFDGGVSVLCKESYLPKLQNLKTLNLYNNEISNLQGIGLLSQTPVEEISLGNNYIGSVPLEFGSIASLTSLWLEDNVLEKFPLALIPLVRLTALRLSGNLLSSIPANISNLHCLRVLVLDNNQLEEFPLGCLSLENLEELGLRQNRLVDIPDDIDGLKNLKTFSISSNKLTSVPLSVTRLETLRYLYANGNLIENVPSELIAMKSIETVNLCNNRLVDLPMGWLEAGAYDAATGAYQTELIVSSSNALHGSTDDISETPVARATPLKISLFGNKIGVMSVDAAE